MKRSEINRAWRRATACLAKNKWALPPNACWDITDFGLGRFRSFGLTLINLTTQPEYCEKVMYAQKGQTTPCHKHRVKKEDIICRKGRLAIRLWAAKPGRIKAKSLLLVPVSGVPTKIHSGRVLILHAGFRVTIEPGIWHEFAPASAECIISEVSTANNDLQDNFFADPRIGRFPGIREDEPVAIRLLSET